MEGESEGGDDADATIVDKGMRAGLENRIRTQHDDLLSPLQSIVPDIVPSLEMGYNRRMQEATRRKRVTFTKHKLRFLTKRGKPGIKKHKHLTFRDKEAKRAQERKKDPTKVWLDLENSALPHDLPDGQLYQRFRDKLTEEGFTGPLKIVATVGYKDSISAKKKKSLCTGMGVTKKNFKFIVAHNFNRPKNSANDQAADEDIKIQIAEWLKKGHSHRNAMLVTGDNGFQEDLQKLQNAGHTTLVAFVANKNQTENSVKLQVYADFIWHWREFLSLPEDNSTRAERADDRIIEKDAERKRKKHAQKKRKREEKKRKMAGW